MQHTPHTRSDHARSSSGSRRPHRRRIHWRPWIAALLLCTLSLCSLLIRGQSLSLPSIPLSSAYDCTLSAGGRAGNALRVQDPHQYVLSRPIAAFPGASNAAGLTQFTVAFWMQQSLAPKHPHLALYELPPRLVGGRALWGLYRYAVLSMDLGGASSLSSIAAAAISDGQWHHVALSWDGSAGGLTRWFLDGALASTTHVAPGYVLPTQGVLSLGQGRYAESFHGQMDEWLWFGAVLSDADRLLLTQASPSSPVDAQLVSLGVLTRNHAITVYSFNQPQTLAGGVETVADSSGQGNDATIVCSTNCWTGAIVPSTAPTFSTGAKTVLLPVTAVQSNYTMQLVHTGSDPFAGSALTITALPSPAIATLYRMHATDPTLVGAALAVNDVVQSSEMPAAVGGFIAVILRVAPSFDFSSSTAFDYSFTPLAAGSTPVSSRIDIGPNHAPDSRPPPGYSSVTASTLPDDSEYLRVVDVDEGAIVDVYVLWRRYPTVEHYAADRDADPVSVYLIQLPLEGRLFQDRADHAADVAITAASIAAPVLVRTTTLTFVAPSARPTLPPLNITFLLTDGRQWAAHTSTLQFSVKALPHLPLVTPLNVSAPQDQATLIQLDIDTAPLPQFDIPFISIQSLPVYGALHQFEPDGTIGAELGVDLLAATRRSVFSISQYLSRVIAYSSQYPDSRGSWNASQLLGPPDAFPAYGDSEQAWAGEFSNRAEWLEMGFEIPVYITALEVFETYNPGHVSDIFARCPVTREWVQIFHNTNLAPAEPAPDAKANVLSPVLCPMIFATNEIRIEIMPAGQTWVEIDAVRIIGMTRPSTLSVSDRQRRLWYVAPRLTRGEDSFTYTVNSCRYFSLYRQIGVATHTMALALVPVNHPPVAANLTVTTGPMGDVAVAALQGLDPDLGDSIQFRILSLPSRGTLFVRLQADAPLRGLVESDLPCTIPSVSDLRFEASANDRCDFNIEGDYADDWVRYEAVDAGSPQLSSEVVTLHLRVYCIRVQRFPSGLVTSIVFFMVLGLLVCVLLAGFLWRHREESVVKASSIMFIEFSIVGTALLYLSLLPLSRSHLSPTWCMLRWVLPCVGFTLLFGSIFVKTYRVYRIVRNKSFQDVALSNDTLGKFVGCMLLACSAVLLVYGIVDPPKPSFQYRFDERHTVLTGCSTNNVFRGLLLGGLGLLTAWGTWLTICVRNVSERFNEGSYLAVSIYNAFLVGGLGIALDFVLDGNPTSQLVIRSFLIIVGLAVCVSMLYLTKVVRLCQQFLMEYMAESHVTERRRKLMQRVYSAAIKAGRTDGEAHALAMAEVERRPSLRASSMASVSTPRMDQSPVLHTRMASTPNLDTTKERAQLLPAAFGGSLLAPGTGPGLQVRGGPKLDRAASMTPQHQALPRKPSTPRAKSHGSRLGFNAAAAAALAAHAAGQRGPTQPVSLPPLPNLNDSASLPINPLAGGTPTMLPAVLESNIDGLKNDEMFFVAAAAATPRLRKHSRSSPAQLYAAAQMQLLHAGIRPNYTSSQSSDSSMSSSVTATPPSASSLLASPLAMVARLPPAQLMQWQSSLNRLIALAAGPGSQSTTATPPTGTTTIQASPMVPVRPLPPLPETEALSPEPVPDAPLSQSPLTTGAQTHPPTPLTTPEQLVHAALLDSTPKTKAELLKSRISAGAAMEPYPCSQWSHDAGALSPPVPVVPASIAAAHSPAATFPTPDSLKSVSAHLQTRLASLQNLDPHSKPNLWGESIAAPSGSAASDSSWLHDEDDQDRDHDHDHGHSPPRAGLGSSRRPLHDRSHDDHSHDAFLAGGGCGGGGPATRSTADQSCNSLDLMLSGSASSGSSIVAPDSVSLSMLQPHQRTQRAMDERVVQVHFEPAVDESMFEDR